MITKTTESWSIHEIGQDPIDGVKVHQPFEDKAWWLCEVHRHRHESAPCIHIKQAQETT